LIPKTTLDLSSPRFFLLKTLQQNMPIVDFLRQFSEKKNATTGSNFAGPWLLCAKAVHRADSWHTQASIT